MGFRYFTARRQHEYTSSVQTENWLDSSWERAGNLDQIIDTTVHENKQETWEKAGNSGIGPRSPSPLDNTGNLLSNEPVNATSGSENIYIHKNKSANIYLKLCLIWSHLIHSPCHAKLAIKLFLLAYGNHTSTARGSISIMALMWKSAKSSGSKKKYWEKQLCSFE